MKTSNFAALDFHCPLGFLTRRETQVLEWLAEGKRNGEIAQILQISARTVGKHIENLMSKLGVETRTAAARQFFEVLARPHAAGKPKAAALRFS